MTRPLQQIPLTLQSQVSKVRLAAAGRPACVPEGHADFHCTAGTSLRQFSLQASAFYQPHFVCEKLTYAAGKYLSWDLSQVCQTPACSLLHTDHSTHSFPPLLPPSLWPCYGNIFFCPIWLKKRETAQRASLSRVQLQECVLLSAGAEEGLPVPSLPACSISGCSRAHWIGLPGLQIGLQITVCWARSNMLQIPAPTTTKNLLITKCIFPVKVSGAADCGTERDTELVSSGSGTQQRSQQTSLTSSEGKSVSALAVVNLLPIPRLPP